MSNKNKIPLNLFSFIHCKKTIPENMQNNWNNIVNLNPEFNCKLFDINDAHNFIEKNFDKDILYSFEKLKPYSYKSDLFRFCYLYINGGIYVDIKYTPVNSFKFIELINNEYLVKEPLGVQTCLIVLKHRSKLMLECISDIVSFTKINFYSHTPLFTGPYLLSELYKNGESIQLKAKQNMNLVAELSWNKISKSFIDRLNIEINTSVSRPVR